MGFYCFLQILFLISRYREICPYANSYISGEENMNSRILAFFIFFAVFSSTPAYAYNIYGSETSSCGEWNNVRKSGDYYQGGTWVLGYVSSYGYYGSKTLKEVDSQALISWMDNYCQANPLDSISDGAKQLIEALIIRK